MAAWFNLYCTTAFLRANVGLPVAGGSFLRSTQIGMAYCEYSYTVSSWKFEKPFLGCVCFVPSNHKADSGSSEHFRAAEARHLPTGRISPVEGKDFYTEET